jgi:toxin ParE1/3/4
VAVALRDTLAANLALIERSPTAFPVVHRDVRRCLLGRFPYALYFRLLPNELRVIACTHLRRHARRWQRRR